MLSERFLVVPLFLLDCLQINILFLQAIVVGCVFLLLPLFLTSATAKLTSCKVIWSMTLQVSDSDIML